MISAAVLAATQQAMTSLIANAQANNIEPVDELEAQISHRLGIELEILGFVTHVETHHDHRTPRRNGTGMAYHRFDLFADRVQTNESLAFEIKRCTFSDDGSHAGHGAYPLGELIGSWFLDIRRLMVGFNPAVATLTRALLIAFSTCGAPALLAGLPTGAAGAAANPELPNLHAVFAALDDGTPAVNAAAVFMQAAMADGIDVQPLPGNPSSMGDATTRSWHPLVLSW